MHNLRTNFVKCYRICKELFKTETVQGFNFGHYSLAPKMNDYDIAIFYLHLNNALFIAKITSNQTF
ncbi:hypothetical protein SAMN05661012_05166 [Chitinophaga sancti]|uniref:Uncharacterized protein n=1 Tax=Chitinophaga sancti TaxID=1004 RepID=A0A1K1SC53_9BACT|nr:hypothetical protein SAMN05661012_05166 [Chitinophaga sancti]